MICLSVLFTTPTTFTAGEIDFTTESVAKTKGAR